MQRALRLIFAASWMTLAAGFIGCGGSKLPVPSERLPGKWHGEMIVYEETQTKLPAEVITKLSKHSTTLSFARRHDGPLGQSIRAGVHVWMGWQPVKQDGDLLTIKSTEEDRETEGHQNRVRWQGYVLYSRRRAASARRRSRRARRDALHTDAIIIWSPVRYRASCGAKSVGLTQPACSFSPFI